jgi:hypothetical protein
MLALAARNVVAGSSAQISFSPQSVDASVGAAVAVDVTVANVDPDPGLAAYDLTLQFDPAVVRLDDFSDSGFITSGENVVICVPGQIDNAGGSANATCTAIPLFGAPGVSTTEAVALLHASFTTLAAGTSALTLSGLLSGPTGTAIAASFGGGTIRVNASQPASSPTTAVAASATLLTVASPAVTATASSTPRVEATPIASPHTRAAPAPPTKTHQASAPSTGGGHGTSILILVVLLAAGAVAIGVTGSFFVWRRLRGKNGS